MVNIMFYLLENLNILLLFTVFSWILISIGDALTFNRINENPLKAFIPFYKDYILYKKFWNTKWFWVQFICCSIYFIIFSIIITTTYNKLDWLNGYLVWWAFSFIPMILLILIANTSLWYKRLSWFNINGTWTLLFIISFFGILLGFKWCIIFLIILSFINGLSNKNNLKNLILINNKRRKEG